MNLKPHRGGGPANHPEGPKLQAAEQVITPTPARTGDAYVDAALKACGHRTKAPVKAFNVLTLLVPVIRTPRSR
jgi:hypothetical protein